jgi:hypothetical protein
VYVVDINPDAHQTLLDHLTTHAPNLYRVRFIQDAQSGGLVNETRIFSGRFDLVTTPLAGDFDLIANVRHLTITFNGDIDDPQFSMTDFNYNSLSPTDAACVYTCREQLDNLPRNPLFSFNPPDEWGPSASIVGFVTEGQDVNGRIYQAFAAINDLVVTGRQPMVRGVDFMSLADYRAIRESQLGGSYELEAWRL